MILKKPTKKQYDSLFGSIREQVATVLALALNDDNSPVFADENTVSYRQFCDVVEEIKRTAEADAEGMVFVTNGLAIVNIYVNEVEQLFAIKDEDTRFEALQRVAFSKLRLHGRQLTQEELDDLPFADQLIAIKKLVKDITGDSESPLPKSAKE